MLEKVDELLEVEVTESKGPSQPYKVYDRNQRAKNYSLVVYPDDMPENQLDIIREDMFDMVISPYHDKNKNPDGAIKTPHYHLLVSTIQSRFSKRQQLKKKQLGGK